MRRILFISAFLLLWLIPGRLSAHQADTTVLQAKLQEYLLAIDRLSIPEAEAEVDFLISSVQDSARRSFVAVKAYEHFRDSKVMGSENVAIYIYDKWFATFKAVFNDIEDLDAAQFHAFINRSSLIGNTAPILKSLNEQGDSLSFPRKGRKTVLYFFSTGCPQCLLNSVSLTRLLNAGHYRLDCVAAYVGEDPVRWQEYVQKNLKIKKTCRTKVFHVIPAEDDFVGAYSVIQTPRMFLIDEDGVIVGRSLDVKALEQLLQ